MKAAIGGVYYGQHNIGDEGILLSMINTFKSKTELSVFTYPSEWLATQFPNIRINEIILNYTKPKYGLYVVPRSHVFTNFAKIKNEIKRYEGNDLYICGGATILSDCPYYSLRTIQLAKKANVPSILWGVGMTDQLDKDGIKYVCQVLNDRYVKRIYVRDEFVKNRVINYGVFSEKVEISYDPAIMLRGSKFNFNKYLDDIQLELYRNDRDNFVFSLSGESDVVKRTPVATICNEINSLVAKYGCNVFLIPTGCGKHCKDRDFLKEVCDTVNNPSVTFIDNEFYPEHLVEFLKGCKIVVSSRLHLNIFAACAGVPSVGLVRNLKNIDFANLFGFPYVSLDQLITNDICNATDVLMEKYEDIAINTLKQVEYMRKVYTKSVNEVLEQVILEGCK